MTRTSAGLMGLICALAALAGTAGRAAGAEETVTLGRFGTVSLYYASPHPSRVVLFVSGDGGWNQGVVDMARTLAGMDALVAGVDIRHYLGELVRSSEACSYPASDFELLSKYLQKKLDYPTYVTPVLVGYSSGATLVYAALVQAPPNTFAGAISMGFCPDLPLTKPFCRGSGLEWTAGPKGKGFNFLPARTLEVPWIAFQGTIDQVCDAKTVEEFVRQVPNAEVVLLPKVGHGFSVPRNWEPQFRAAVGKLTEAKAQIEPAAPPPAAPLSADVQDLPLVEVPATGPPADKMAVLVTGDGGWGVTDRGLGNTLAAHGIPVVALNSLRYFWTKKTPEQAAQDLARVLRHYQAAWKKDHVLLIGYSLGADVLPFMANRLPPELLAGVDSVVLLGPGHSVDFEFHLTDWFGAASHAADLPVLPEVKKLSGKKLVCFYGARESDSLCPDLPPGLADVVRLAGGHRIGGGYEAVADTILDVIR